MRTNSDLFDYASAMLLAAEASLTRAGIVLPTNRYISYELPDLVCCDTLAIRHLPPRLKTTKGADQWTARVELTISRCVQIFTRDGNLPPLTKVEEDAAVVLADRWALMRFLLDEYHCDLPPCGEPFIESVNEVNAANCAGSAFVVGLVLP